MCDFCKKIYCDGDTVPNKDVIIFIEEDGSFAVWADPPGEESGLLVCNIKYCTYCGRKLKLKDVLGGK